jgi:hopanoid biosynthesis associated radical SAM protein HpnH
MRFPLRLTCDLARYIAGNRLKKIARFPLVLMLEPTHLCNLACSGCGRIREYADSIGQMMPLAECLSSVDECPAPIVTITGGEPLLYPEISELTAGILARGKHIQFCTNALLLKDALPHIPNHLNLTLNIHLDGLEATHDRTVAHNGAYRTAIEAIVEAKQQGYRVCTNTTIFRNTDLLEIEMLFAKLTEMGVDGLLVAPGFDYEAAGKEMFLARLEIERKFQAIYEMSSRFHFWSTPMYLRFLKGEQRLQCTPWGNPTRNPQGWKAPCYLITDAHYPTYKEMMAKTDWSRYGVGRDERCSQCMMHCGFEPSVVNEVSRNWRDMVEMALWNVT